ncbi:MAG TPA: hypothetical protein VHF91_08235, partial [Acidimicrobiales bacterium]|nr:hypothetical protein [Acidimicrobiales bacterium]
PFPQAEVVVCADYPAGPQAAERLTRLDLALHAVLTLKAELGEAAGDATTAELSPDPELATWQAAALAPLGPLDAQRLLETDAGSERLDLVLSLLEEEAGVLAQRLSGG